MNQNYANFLRHGIRSVNRSLLNKETTVTKLCSDALNQINRFKHLNPFITILDDIALTKAAQLEEGCAASNHLHGIPISIKDNFCMEQVLTTCGSKMLYNYIPPYTATAVKKLQDANCIIMGKTNMDEFAMGSSSTTSYYGPSANSWKSDELLNEKPSSSNSQHWYMAGGSSTGSAISVSSGSCFASLATDTGGSTRQPASLAGIVGFKPTYGLISRFGLIPLAHCLDVVSILARNVEDTQIVFDAIVGQDENDLTTVDHNKVMRTSMDGKRILRVGVPEEFIAKGDISNDISYRFDQILTMLQRNDILSDKEKFDKIEVIKLSLPNSSLATECYTIISSAEIASNMSCYDGVKYGYASKIEDSEHFDRDEFYKRNRDESFGSEVKKRILLGNYFLMEQNRDKYFVQALKLRRFISEEFDNAFKERNVDVIIMPSTPSTSVSYNDWLKKQDKNRLFHEDYFLIPSNLANLPSISLPAGLSEKGLPIGLQLIGNKYHDLDLMQVSKFFESKLLGNIM